MEKNGKKTVRRRMNRRLRFDTQISIKPYGTTTSEVCARPVKRKNKSSVRNNRQSNTKKNRTVKYFSLESLLKKTSNRRRNN